MIYEVVHARHEEELNVLGKIIGDLQTQLDRLYAELQPLLPDMVWVKVGKYAVGVECSQYRGFDKLVRSVNITFWGEHRAVQLDNRFRD